MSYLDKHNNYYADLKAVVDSVCDSFVESSGCKDCPPRGVRVPAGDKVCTECEEEQDLMPYEHAIMTALGLEHKATVDFCEDPAHTPDVVTQETFEALVKEIRDASLETLIKKNANYAAGEDKIHNFRAGGAILGKSPAQVALGYMTKHLVSLIDKVERDDFTDRDDLLEKCQDIINYTAIIWVCGNEGRGST